jgi:hypothetical protein
MGILDMINGMNGGKGMRCVTDEGRAEMNRRGRELMQQLGMGTREFNHSEHYRKLEDEIFAPENEGKYWGYATAVERPVKRGRS